MSGKIVVETSSWADPEFIGTWYPKDLPAKQRLAWHAQWFDAVEVNTSFYAVPTPDVVQRWVDETPDGFTFDVKLHRLLSFHRTPVETLPRNLQAAARSGASGKAMRSGPLVAATCQAILESIAPLEDAGRLASLLLQLAPSFSPAKHSLDELDPVFSALAGRRIAVEVRHRGWVEGAQLDRTLAWLRERGGAYVGTDGPTSDDDRTPPPVTAVTAPELAYLRLHGRNAEGFLHGTSVAERFNHRYTDDELHEIIGRARTLAEQAGEVRVAFNTNRGDLAPRAAARMRVLLGQRGEEPPGEQLALGL